MQPRVNSLSDGSRDSEPESANIIRIDSLTRRAQALAAAADGTEFIADGPLPGDILNVRSYKQRSGKNYVTDWKLIEGAQGRRRAPCPVAATCGGCSLMALEEQAQYTAKIRYVHGALERLGISPPETRFIHDGSAFHYRNRIRLAVDTSGKLGFFNRNKAQGCLVLTDPLHEALSEIRHRLSDTPPWMRNVAHIEVRAPDLDHNAGVFITGRDPVLSRPLIDAPPDLGSNFLIGVHGQAPRHIPRQRIELMPRVWAYVPLSSFMQVNARVNADLVMYVAAGALKRSAKTFVDLYSGAGNFTLPLLAIGLQGAAVEQDVASVFALTEAANAQRLDPPDTVATDAIATARHWAERGEEFDLVIVDPPRAGLRDGVEGIARIAGKHIAMCSCSPESMARDTRRFLELGFEIEELMAFDMFPQTHHVESLVWLVRK